MEKNEPELKEVRDKQAGFLREMLDISCRQLEFCQREDMESGDLSLLMELISRRQNLMDEIDRLHLSPAPGAVSAAGAEDSELARMAGAISRNDEACLGLLQGKSSELAARLKEARVNRRAVDAYTQGNSVPAAWFVDKKK